MVQQILICYLSLTLFTSNSKKNSIINQKIPNSNYHLDYLSRRQQNGQCE